jgi:hypothetical protein
MSAIAVVIEGRVWVLFKKLKATRHLSFRSLRLIHSRTRSSLFLNNMGNNERTYIMVKVRDQLAFPPRWRSLIVLIFIFPARRRPEGTGRRYHRPFREARLQTGRLEARSCHPRAPREACVVFISFVSKCNLTDRAYDLDYADLKDKPFFPGLITYMASGPVVAIVWEGLDAVKTGRSMLGATNPLASAPGWSIPKRAWLGTAALIVDA